MGAGKRSEEAEGSLLGVQGLPRSLEAAVRPQAPEECLAAPHPHAFMP